MREATLLTSPAGTEGEVASLRGALGRYYEQRESGTAGTFGREFAVHVSVSGGGPTGQSCAIAMGLARALRRYDASYEEKLRTSGLLTRDSRMKERKKYGRRGARRGFQFSKR